MSAPPSSTTEDGRRTSTVQTRRIIEEPYYPQTVPTQPAAATVAADRTRWGPVWAGFVTAISVFLVLEALLLWLGVLGLKASAGGVVMTRPWITWLLALGAFFVGALVTASTSPVRGVLANMLNGFFVWALATTLIAVASFFGAGVAFGTLGNLIARFVALGALKHLSKVTSTTVSDLKTAAGWAFLTLITTAVAAAIGGGLGGIGEPVGSVETTEGIKAS